MPTYKLFDINGRDVTPQELQKKGEWCIAGANKEDVFIDLYGNKLGLIINPEKEYNKYAADLYYRENGKLADLKTQNTPFFNSKRYGLPPQTSVTFNLKDQLRYNERYPDIDIIFWVDWQSVRFENKFSQINVEPMKGVWKINMKKFNEILAKAPLHSYVQRRNDTKGNAKSSYVVDLTHPFFERLF